MSPLCLLKRIKFLPYLERYCSQKSLNRVADYIIPLFARVPLWSTPNRQAYLSSKTGYPIGEARTFAPFIINYNKLFSLKGRAAECSYGSILISAHENQLTPRANT